MLSLPPNVSGKTKGYLYIKIQLLNFPTRLPRLRLRWWGDISGGVVLRAGKGKVYSARFDVKCSMLQFSRYLCDMIPLKVEMVDENLAANGFSQLPDLGKLSKLSPIHSEYTIESVAEHSLGQLKASIWLEDVGDRPVSVSSLSTTDLPKVCSPEAHKMDSVLLKDDSSFRSLANCSEGEYIAKKPIPRQKKSTTWAKTSKECKKRENNPNLITTLLRKTESLIKEAEKEPFRNTWRDRELGPPLKIETITSKIHDLLLDQINNDFSDDEIPIADNLFTSRYSLSSSSEDLPSFVEPEPPKTFLMAFKQIKLILTNTRSFVAVGKPPLQESQFSLLIRFLNGMNSHKSDVALNSGVQDGLGTDFVLPEPFNVSIDKQTVEIIFLLYYRIINTTKKKPIGVASLCLPWDSPRSFRTKLTVTKSQEDPRPLGQLQVEIAVLESVKEKPVIAPTLQPKVTPIVATDIPTDLPPIFTLLMILEGSNVGIPIIRGNPDSRSKLKNPYLVSKMFWLSDVRKSEVFFGTTNPKFSFCQVSPLVTSAHSFDKMQNNHLIVEVWDRKTFESEDQLIGLVKVPLHGVSTAFLNTSPKFWESDLLTVVDQWMPIRNPLLGTHLGSLSVFFAVGTKVKIDKIISDVVLPKIKSNAGGKSGPPQNETSPAVQPKISSGQLIKHATCVKIHSLENIDFLSENADIFVQYYFPQKIHENGVELASFRTSFRTMESLNDFNDSHLHSICLPTCVSYTKELLKAFEGNDGLRLEIWVRNYVPAIVDRLVATANLELCKLMAISATFDETGMTSVAKHHFRLPLEMTNLSAFSQTRDDCFLHLILSYERLMEAEEVEDIGRNLLIDLKLNNVVVKMPNEMFFRVLCPRRTDHCGRVLANGKCVPAQISAMSISDESSLLRLEIWGMPTSKFPTPLTKFELAMGDTTHGFKLLAYTDIFLTKLVLKETGLNQWLSLLEPGTEDLIGGVNISLRYTKEGERNRSLGLSPHLALPNLWPIDAKNHQISFKFSDCQLEFDVDLRLHFNSRHNYLYIRLKYYNQETEHSKPVILQRLSNGRFVAEIEQSLTYLTQLNPSYCWFTREETVEIEIWITTNANQAIFPTQNDFYVGSSYVDLIDLFIDNEVNHLCKKNHHLIFKASEMKDCVVPRGSYLHVAINFEFINKIPPQPFERPEFSSDSVLLHVVIERGSQIELGDGAKVTPNVHVVLTSPVWGQTSSVESSNPTWNFEIDVQIPKSTIKRDNIIRLDVFHSADESHSQNIGSVHVDLKPLLVGMPELYGWYNVVDSLRNSRGQIKLAIVPLYFPVNDQSALYPANNHVTNWSRPQISELSVHSSYMKDHDNIISLPEVSNTCDTNDDSTIELSSMLYSNVDDHNSVYSQELASVDSDQLTYTEGTLNIENPELKSDLCTETEPMKYADTYFDLPCTQNEDYAVNGEIDERQGELIPNFIHEVSVSEQSDGIKSDNPNVPDPSNFNNYGKEDNLPNSIKNEQPPEIKASKSRENLKILEISEFIESAENQNVTESYEFPESVGNPKILETSVIPDDPCEPELLKAGETRKTLKPNKSNPDDTILAKSTENEELVEANSLQVNSTNSGKFDEICEYDSVKLPDKSNQVNSIESGKNSQNRFLNNFDVFTDCKIAESDIKSRDNTVACQFQEVNEEISQNELSSSSAETNDQTESDTVVEEYDEQKDFSDEEIPLSTEDESVNTENATGWTRKRSSNAEAEDQRLELGMEKSLGFLENDESDTCDDEKFRFFMPASEMAKSMKSIMERISESSEIKEASNFTPNVSENRDIYRIKKIFHSNK